MITKVSAYSALFLILLFAVQGMVFSFFFSSNSLNSISLFPPFIIIISLSQKDTICEEVTGHLLYGFTLCHSKHLGDHYLAFVKARLGFSFGFRGI